MKKPSLLNESWLTKHTVASVMEIHHDTVICRYSDHDPVWLCVYIRQLSGLAQ